MVLLASFRLPPRHYVNLRKQAGGGSLFFGFFWLSKIKKLASRARATTYIRRNAFLLLQSLISKAYYRIVISLIAIALDKISHPSLISLIKSRASEK